MTISGSDVSLLLRVPSTYARLEARDLVVGDWTRPTASGSSQSSANLRAWSLLDPADYTQFSDLVWTNDQTAVRYELVPADGSWRIFGVHLSAVHAAWTERRRSLELRALLREVAAHQHGPHVLIGDFNTVAPGDIFDLTRLPRRLRALVWLSGGHIRWRTIADVLGHGYIDTFRKLHPGDVGYTLPTPDAHVRLDYAFVPGGFTQNVALCEIVRGGETSAASDHFPLLLEVREP